MTSTLLEKFKTEIATVSDQKNLSKHKIQEITKAAIRAKAEYKHVVYLIEKLLTKSKPQQRLSVFYIIDSIIRVSKHQFKGKDVFGPRFLKCFDKTLDRLLECGLRERLQIVRTLNIWMSNKIFAKDVIQPLREKCKRAGLEIGFEEVEKAVKGKDADMSIYNGAYKKRSKSSKKPSEEDGLLGAGPSSLLAPVTNLPSFSLSEEYHNGTISEREMLELSRQFGLDRSGVLSKDRDLLQKTLQTFSEKLKSQIAEVQAERIKQSGSSIQNVLTANFEYSDDEEEKERDAEPEKPKNLTHDEIFELAQKLLSVPTVVAQLTEVFDPRPSLPPTSTLLQGDIIPKSIGTLTLGQVPNLLALQSMSALNPQQLGFPNMSGLNATQLLNMHNAQNILLQQRAAQLQALQGMPSAQHNLLMMGNPLLNAFGVPTSVNPVLTAADLQAASLQNQSATFPDFEMTEAKPDLNSEAASKTRSKEGRERRKMGLPQVKPGHTIIASRTLWLKKIPSNVTENELKQSVESCGEASRVKIIGNRACAFITMDTRKAANDVVQKLREVSLARKMVKVYWARGPGMDTEDFSDLWDSDRGLWEIAYSKLPEDLVPLCEGAVLDLDSLPEDKKPLFKENGEKNVAPPLAAAPQPIPPPVSASSLGFPFSALGPFPGHQNFSALGATAPKPPGVPPLLNLSVPPPGGLPPFPPAPPPPGVPAHGGNMHSGIPPMGMNRPPGMPPHGLRQPLPPGIAPPGFDPNKPPPMFQQAFHPNAPPPPSTFGPGRGGPPMPQFRRGMPPPMPFRGGRGNGSPFDARRGAMPFRSDELPRERPSLMDQRELWNQERERDRSNGDRRRIDPEAGNGRRRASRWGNDDRREDIGDVRRRSPEERPSRHSVENEDQWEQPVVKKSGGDEETVSSTTIDEMKPPEVVVKVDLPQVKPDEVSEDKTDEVPMDLE